MKAAVYKNKQHWSKLQYKACITLIHAKEKKDSKWGRRDTPIGSLRSRERETYLGMGDWKGEAVEAPWRALKQTTLGGPSEGARKVDTLAILH